MFLGTLDTISLVNLLFVKEVKATGQGQRVI